MPEVEQALLWVRREDYPRFVEVCDGKVYETHAEFVESVEYVEMRMRAAGMLPYRVQIDPDAMAAWCAGRFGKVDSTARSTYVAMVALSEGPDALD